MWSLDQNEFDTADVVEMVWFTKRYYLTVTASHSKNVRGNVLTPDQTDINGIINSCNPLSIPV